MRWPEHPPTEWDGKIHGSAETARHHGWTVGTRLAGDEGYGVTVIEITAVGEEHVLAKTLSPVRYRESSWFFDARDWKEVTDVETETEAATDPVDQVEG